MFPEGFASQNPGLMLFERSSKCGSRRPEPESGGNPSQDHCFYHNIMCLLMFLTIPVQLMHSHSSSRPVTFRCRSRSSCLVPLPIQGPRRSFVLFYFGIRLGNQMPFVAKISTNCLTLNAMFIPIAPLTRIAH